MGCFSQFLKSRWNIPERPSSPHSPGGTSAPHTVLAVRRRRDHLKAGLSVGQEAAASQNLCPYLTKKRRHTGQNGFSGVLGSGVCTRPSLYCRSYPSNGPGTTSSSQNTAPARRGWRGGGKGRCQGSAGAGKGNEAGAGLLPGPRSIPTLTPLQDPPPTLVKRQFSEPNTIRAYR